MVPSVSIDGTLVDYNCIKFLNPAGRPETLVEATLYRLYLI